MTTHAPWARVLSDTNPSLKRLAWAYGCAQKGSDEEAQLLKLLQAKIRQESLSPRNPDERRPYRDPLCARGHVPDCDCD